MRVHLSKRDKDKLTFMETWVGNLEVLGSNLLFIIEEDVKIDRPGTPSKGFPSPEP